MINNFTPDCSQAEKFLKTLDPNSSSFLFFAIQEQKGKRKAISNGYYSFEKAKNSLINKNRQGYGIFVVVNKTDDSKQRKSDNIIKPRALFVDDDQGCVNENQFLPPHISVKTSKGKYHHYWLTDKNFTCEDFREISADWVDAHDGDKQVKDLSRILRLPGFYHMKGKPQLVEMVHCDDKPLRYGKDDFEQFLKSENYNLDKTIPKDPENLNTFKVKEALAYINPDCIYDEWIKVGMALHQEFGTDGLVLWDDWSAKGVKYIEGECANKWKSFKPSIDGITIGTLFSFAQKNGFNLKSADKTDKTTVRPWGEIKELPSEFPIAKSMLPEDLPPILRDWCNDIAERMGVPLEMAAVPATIALSSVISRQYRIKPKAKDNWEVVPNLWGIVIAPPSAKKTPVLKATLKPLKDIANKMQEESERQVILNKRTQDVLDQKIKKLQKEIVKSKSDAESKESLEKELCNAQEEHDALNIAISRMVINDSTQEMVAELLKENPKGLLLERDELSGWFEEFNKPNYASARSFYLSCWNGDSSYSVDRIGRGSSNIKNLTLSVIGTIQPQVMKTYLKDALKGGKQADGLMQRFQLAVWPENMPADHYVDKEADKEAFYCVVKLFEKLTQESGEKQCLSFTPQAQVEFSKWLKQNQIETRKYETHSEAFASHLGKYSSMVASLALIFEVLLCYEKCNLEEMSSISNKALSYAFKWFDILRSHAHKLYAIEIDKGVSEAHVLAEKIQRGYIFDGDTIRDIKRHGWSGLTQMDNVELGLQILEAYGWVQVVTSQQEGGGRPSKVIKINPNI